MKRKTKKTIKLVLLIIVLLTIVTSVCVLDRHLHQDVYQTIGGSNE
jgi:hypothetical protein